MTARFIPALAMMAVLAGTAPALAATVAPARPPPVPHAPLHARPPRVTPLRVGKQNVMIPRHTPTTAEQHEMMARTLEGNAITYHQVAQVQRDLIGLMKAGPPEPTAEGRRQLARMQARSAALVQDAERLAALSQKGAEFHRQLARQLARQ